MKPLTFKIILSIGVTLASLVWIMPTFYNSWPHKKINLGLDLQGGMHLVLEVQSIDGHREHVGILETQRLIIGVDGVLLASDVPG